MRRLSLLWALIAFFLVQGCFSDSRLSGRWNVYMGSQEEQLVPDTFLGSALFERGHFDWEMSGLKTAGQYQESGDKLAFRYMRVQRIDNAKDALTLRLDKRLLNSAEEYWITWQSDDQFSLRWAKTDAAIYIYVRANNQ